jgi:acyl-CoA thioesterase-2
MDGMADELLALLDLQDAGEGTFIGPPSGDGWIRVFGGQLLGQALAAASFTVGETPCHSLHAYFLRPGKPGRPTEYEIAAMRDGQSFATRNVVGVQRDEVTFQLVASFQQQPTGTPGPEHQLQMPDVPPPESFPDEDTRIAQMLEQAPDELKAQVSRKRPIEMIRTGALGLGADPKTGPSSGPTRTWMRTRGKLFDDPNLHRCALAYASDMGPIEPCLRATGGRFGDITMQVASLDHALWFHRPFRFDDWLLFSFESASVSAGRGFSRGSVFDREGRLVASVAQEAIMRARE